MFNKIQRLMIAAAASAALQLPAMAATQKPNVLLIMADDLNTDLASYGSKRAITPNLDRLAARSVQFDRAYAQYPLCAPSRASLLSGRRPSSTGVMDNKTPATSTLEASAFLPARLKQAGYLTISLGKVFHNQDGDQAEVAEDDPTLIAGPIWTRTLSEPRDGKRPPKESIVEDRPSGALAVKENDPTPWDKRLAGAAAAELANLAKQNQPWLLAVGFRRPHVPYIAPARFFEMTAKAPVTIPANDAAALSRIPEPALTYRRGETGLDPDAKVARVRDYLATITYLDEQVGQVISAVSQNGLWKNTVVIFVSDHGIHTYEHGGLDAKYTLFEEANRVPLMIAAPGMAKGRAASVAELLDIAPTITELAGLPVTPTDGTSLVPQLRKPSTVGKDFAISELLRGGKFSQRGRLNADGITLDRSKRGLSLRTARYRYTEWYTGEKELYDHDADPGETWNLAGLPGSEDIMRKLSAQLAATAPSLKAP